MSGVGTPGAFGDRALLLEFDDTTAVLAAAAALRDAALPGVVDVVTGAETVLLVLDSPAYLPTVRRLVAHVRPPPATESAGTEHVIDVGYDGADLDEVARLTGLDRAAVIAARQARRMEMYDDYMRINPDYRPKPVYGQDE